MTYKDILVKAKEIVLKSITIKVWIIITLVTVSFIGGCAL